MEWVKCKCGYKKAPPAGLPTKDQHVHGPRLLPAELSAQAPRLFCQPAAVVAVQLEGHVLALVALAGQPPAVAYLHVSQVIDVFIADDYSCSLSVAVIIMA